MNQFRVEWNEGEGRRCLLKQISRSSLLPVRILVVVLLDFHMFGMKESAARILSLRDLYAKYHAQGLEIYQVGLDENEHFWKQQTESLPWICVYDPSAQSALHYNVQNVPEYFLIDRNSQLYKRSTQMKDVEEEIQNLLK